MTHKKDLEQVLEYLINEDVEKADELMHEILVGKARAIYESLEDVEVGSMDDFNSEIDKNQSDIDVEEQGSDSVGAEDKYREEGEDEGEDEGEEGEDLEVEDRVEDLEAELAELRAQFDALMAEELEEPEHQGEDELQKIQEATEFLKKVDGSLDSEDELAGAGKTAKADKDSMLTKAPAKAVVTQGEPVLSKGEVTAPKAAKVGQIAGDNCGEGEPKKVSAPKVAVEKSDSIIGSRK